MRLIRPLLAALLLAGSVLLLAGPAQGAACAGDDGVTVVVQFPDGHTETGCAAGDPDSGLAALSGAGFGYAFEARNPGFVCQIKSLPADRSCMKPRYWAYFHSTGGSWTYSSEGASTYDPAPGSTEGWRFGTGDAPGTPAHSPSPTPTKPPTKAPTKAPAAAPTTAAASPSASASATPSASASASDEPSASATPSASESSGAVAGDDASPVAAPAVEDQPGSSGTVSWAWGLGLLGVVAVVAVVAAVLRRRTG